MYRRFAFTVLSVATTAALAAPGWTLVDIGTLGGSGSYGAAVSNSGYVAGCADTKDGSVHAFVFQNGTLQDLGPGCALAVNNAGLAAGRSGAGELVIWKEGAAFGLGVQGNIGGINDAGAVAGTRTAGTSTRAFVFRDGVVNDLGTLDDRDPHARSEATGINGRDQVVGSSNGRAFLHEAGRMRDLGTLGGNNSAARGINARGEVVGGSANEFGAPSAFIYSETMKALPAPAYSSAIALNATRQVVGSGEGIRGFILEGSTTTRLEQIPAVVAKGWRRLEPTGINDRGWIVGTGENASGDLRAFLLVPSGTKPRRLAIN